MKKVWTEVTCDQCNSAQHYPGVASNEDVADYDEQSVIVEGVGKDAKHFCDDKCQAEFKANS